MKIKCLSFAIIMVAIVLSGYLYFSEGSYYGEETPPAAINNEAESTGQSTQLRLPSPCVFEVFSVQVLLPSCPWQRLQGLLSGTGSYGQTLLLANSHHDSPNR